MILLEVPAKHSIQRHFWLRVALLSFTLLFPPLHAVLSQTARSVVFASTGPSHASTYCSKELGSVPLSEDDNLGFDVSLTKCRAQCDDTPDCAAISFGKWSKGLPVLGYRGKMRCQLYKVCHTKHMKDSVVHEKARFPLMRAGVYALQVGINAASFMFDAYIGVFALITTALLPIVCTQELNTNIGLGWRTGPAADESVPFKLDASSKRSTQCAVIICACHAAFVLIQWARLMHFRSKLRVWFEAESRKPQRLVELEELLSKEAEQSAELASSRQQRSAFVDVLIGSGTIGAIVYFIYVQSLRLCGMDGVCRKMTVLNSLTSVLIGVDSNSAMLSLFMIGGIFIFSAPLVLGLGRVEHGLRLATSAPDNAIDAARIARQAHRLEDRMIGALECLKPLLSDASRVDVPVEVLESKARLAMADAPSALTFAAQTYFAHGPDDARAIKALQRQVNERAVEFLHRAQRASLSAEELYAPKRYVDDLQRAMDDAQSRSGSVLGGIVRGIARCISTIAGFQLIAVPGRESGAARQSLVSAMQPAEYMPKTVGRIHEWETRAATDPP